jgi:hypothetical protein
MATNNVLGAKLQKNAKKRFDEMKVFLAHCTNGLSISFGRYLIQSGK